MIVFGIDSRFGKALFAEITVNGMPAATIEPGHDSFQSLAIHQDVVPGANRIEAVLTVPGDQTGAPPLGDPMTMFATIALEADELTETSETYEVTTTPVDSVQWEAPDGERLALPHRLTLDWVAPPSVTPPIWTRAQPMGPEQARIAVATELEALRDLLTRRDIEGFQARMRLRNEDMARAYPVSGSAAHRARADSAMLDALLPPRPLFAPIDRASLTLRPFAQGRVVECRAADGRPPLHCLNSDGDPIEIETAFAMIDGKVAAIR